MYTITTEYKVSHQLKTVMTTLSLEFPTEMLH